MPYSFLSLGITSLIMLSSFLALSIAQTVDFVFLLRTSAISSSGAASAEAKLVWIMPSRDRARRSQAYLNIAEVRTDGAARAEPSPGLSYAESRQRKTKSRRKTKSTCLDYAESRQRKTKSNEGSITCLLLKKVHGYRRYFFSSGARGWYKKHRFLGSHAKSGKNGAAGVG